MTYLKHKFQELREVVFLTIANHFTRLKVLDPYRYLLYRLSGIKVKGRAAIFGPLSIRPIGKASNIEIGQGTFLNTDIRFGCPDHTIRIGANCQIGPRVCFETVNHGLYYEPNKGRGMSTQPIVIEDEVWIGCGAIILPGVTIGKGAVIAAGAVVNQSVPKLTVYGGVPAKPLKQLS